MTGPRRSKCTAFTQIGHSRKFRDHTDWPIQNSQWRLCLACFSFCRYCCSRTLALISGMDLWKRVRNSRPNIRVHGVTTVAWGVVRYLSRNICSACSNECSACWLERKSLLNGPYHSRQYHYWQGGRMSYECATPR